MILRLNTGKSIEYIHWFIDVNEMVNTTITIVNIPFILYHVFLTLYIYDRFITIVVLTL